MKYLIFDIKAIEIIVRTRAFQSVEYTIGSDFVKHCCGELKSQVINNIYIEHTNDGVIFCGKKEDESAEKTLQQSGRYRIFCVDLTTCDLLSERNNPSDFLTVLQKAFRAALKFWTFQPFSFSERIHGSKSIIFPFAITDKRRIVIERSNKVDRLEKRGIINPLLAYKYNADEPPQGEEIVDCTILRKAGEHYIERYFAIQNMLKSQNIEENTVENDRGLRQITTTELVGSKDFVYLDYQKQIKNLTKTQKNVVEYASINSPLRVDGAAGTGKTVSLILRAYRLLQEYRERDQEIHMAFFVHSESTKQRNIEMFCRYQDSEFFINKNSKQNIFFDTLLNFCSEFANMPKEVIIEKDAGDAKTYQLMLIENVVEKAHSDGSIRTYSPLISSQLRELFDKDKTMSNVLYSMLQHEFSVQIKGRTDGTFQSYIDIEPIKNGLPCISKKDKELIFLLYNNYQKSLNSLASYDVDDVTMEALSRLNAPMWRRERVINGYHYIFVDEMHLFNLNEQSVFHYLTRDMSQENVPICFALDYSQAIGDRGNVELDYIEKAFGHNVERMNYKTVFRNSPQIADFCTAIAASGTLMFQESFSNPYKKTQSSFTVEEENKCHKPTLYMYPNDEEMLKSVSQHITKLKRDLKCQPYNIAIISFNNLANDEGRANLSAITGQKIARLGSGNEMKSYILASPYEINGLEFDAVLLLGVDEGRLPQTFGVSDISQHYVKYSALNMLYLTASRAKYGLILLGSRTNGLSSCLELAINKEKINLIER